MNALRTTALRAAIFVLLVGDSASAATMCQSFLDLPRVVTKFEKDNAAGQLVLVDKNGVRVFKDGCYRYPSAFSKGTLRFKAYYVADAADDAQQQYSDYLGVKLIRIVGDAEDDPDARRVDQVKAYRSDGWFREKDGASQPLKATDDMKIEGGLDAWNEVHLKDGASLSDYDAALGVIWHARVDEPKGESYRYHALWYTPRRDYGEQYRYVISNQIVRYSKSAYEIPFQGRIYDKTDVIVIYYFFGRDPAVHRVVLCRDACSLG